MTAKAGKWDVRVRECVAVDSQERASLVLQDKAGCLAQPKMMTPFVLTRDRKDHKARIAYSFLKAFRFPDDMQVQIKCVVAVCRERCEKPDPCPRIPPDVRLANSSGLLSQGSYSEDRDESYRTAVHVSDNAKQAKEKRSPVLIDRFTGILPVKRTFTVISAEDIASLKNLSVPQVERTAATDSICVNELMFAVLLTLLLSIILITLIALTIICLKYRSLKSQAAKQSEGNDTQEWKQWRIFVERMGGTLSKFRPASRIVRQEHRGVTYNSANESRHRPFGSP